MVKKSKRGRPKGSKNKSALEFSIDNMVANRDINLEPAPTRLDVLMTEFEIELQRVISKLKAVF